MPATPDRVDFPRQRAATVPQEEQHGPIRTDTRVARAGVSWYPAASHACPYHPLKVETRVRTPLGLRAQRARSGH